MVKCTIDILISLQNFLVHVKALETFFLNKKFIQITFYVLFFHKIICKNKYRIFDPVRLKDTFVTTDFDVKKDPGEAECWIYKISQSGHKFWSPGYEIF